MKTVLPSVLYHDEDAVLAHLCLWNTQQVRHQGNLAAGLHDHYLLDCLSQQAAVYRTILYPVHHFNVSLNPFTDLKCNRHEPSRPNFEMVPLNINDRNIHKKLTAEKQQSSMCAYPCTGLEDFA